MAAGTPLDRTMESPVNVQMRGNLFVVVAPSGAGKTSLVNALLEQEPNIKLSISYTTRAPRSGEKHARDYHFVSRKAFEEMIAAADFLEHANVYGNYYGTHRTSIDHAVRDRKDLVLDIDVQGARQLKSKLPEAVTVFILPPSKRVLEERLRARGEDRVDVIERRLRDAAKEIENYRAYDYVLINRELEESAARLTSIVRAERLRKAKMEEEVRPILESFEKN